MKLLTCIGTRPQFIKAATVSRALSLYDDIQEVIVHTGQHYDANMSSVFFEELCIPQPNYNLSLGGGYHGEMTGRMLTALETVIIEEKPDAVLVYGDTNSTLAGALAAVKLHVPVAHVEAGLRSFNRRMPEEINRILTDHASDILFAPTAIAVKNLEHEGFAKHRVHLVGDVMYDAALYYGARARMPDLFTQKGLEADNFILATIHRAENTDDPKRLGAILSGLSRAGQRVILPLHPRTRQRINEFDIAVPASIILTEPVSYLEMVWLEVHASVVATDSGGVQKEAFFHGTPCVTLRDETEWLELVETGWNRLVGANENRVVDALNSNFKMQRCNDIYGDGHASNRIVKLIEGLVD